MKKVTIRSIRPIINLNFACAVSNKKNEANAWGTEEATAWNVRHADQFIGSLYLSTNQNEVQKEYLGSCFRQTHDIDMADRSSSALYKFDAVFRGVYDGGNFSITNVHVNQDKYFVSGDQRGSAMLFPKVEGSESKKAALRNIVITEDPSVITGGLVSWETNPINAYFGVLAGAVSYCEVSDCSLVGAEKEDDDPLRINVKTTQGNVYGGGALIGAAFDSTIDRSGVVGIYFDSKRTAGDWGSNLTLGSLVGYVSNSQIESSYARGVTVSTETRAHHTSSFNGYSLNIGDQLYEVKR